MNIVRLKAEDLTGLGGPMGTESTETMFEEFFYDAAAAREFAYKDYKTRCKGEYRDKNASFKFKKEGRNWSSPDLGFIQYTIEPIKVREQ